MAPKASQEGLSDLEKQRLKFIADRDAALAELQIQKKAQEAGLYAKPVKRPAPASKKRSTAIKRIKVEEIQPHRTSSRIRGIQADSELAKQEAEKQYEEAKEADRIKRQRRTGDLELGDIIVNGKLNGFFGSDAVLRSVARPYERSFGDEQIRQTTDKDIQKLQKKMNGLELWNAWDPTRIKITPERIYSGGFHPTEEKPIVFMGDKLGHLGIVDASQTNERIKSEEEDDDDEEEADPVITTVKPHTRTISSMHIHPSKAGALYTGSYDSSIRSVDLEKQKAVEIWGPTDTLEDSPVSGIDMSAADPNVIYFTTLGGAFGQHDIRADAARTKLFELSEKKIGGFTLNPRTPHYMATASLDRTMKLWDLRKLSKNLPTLVGEHESRLSVSHAAFNTAGQVATSSYDDTIKIHSFGAGGANKASGTDNLESMATWKVGRVLSEDVMEPEVTIRHNNQTGRWVTILRPQWQRYPQDGIQKFVIGNMNRFVDVYAANGQQLAQLGGDGITAVPAVAVFHPTKDWIAAGTASGKLCLWM